MSTNVSDTATAAAPTATGDGSAARDGITVEPSAPTAAGGRLRPERSATTVAVIMRLAVGCIYLWAFVSQAVGISYSNTPFPPPGAPRAAAASTDYGWHFRVDGEKGFLTSGFSASPTAGYVKNSTHGPLAAVPQNLGKGADFLWMFALGGLALALLLGIFMRIAGWGAVVLNLIMWFSAFPPQFNPILDNEHMMLALGVLLLALLNAGDHVGLGRWWKARTPAFLH